MDWLRRKHFVIFSVLVVIFILAWWIWSFVFVPAAGPRAIEAPTPPAAPSTTHP